MIDLADMGNFLCPRIADANGFVEFLANGDVNGVIDGSGEHAAAMTTIVGREIRTSAKEAYAKGSL